MEVTLERVDAALADSAELDIDDRAMLWVIRADLLGIHLTADHLVYLLGVSHQEALDITARLSERDLIELL